MNSGRAYNQPATYRIYVRGDLGKLSKRFDGLEIVRQDNGEALLTGSVVDREMLHRVLCWLRDCRIPVRYLQIAET